MTEWTSISLKARQKQVIETHKPDGMNMGDYVVMCVDSHESDDKNSNESLGYEDVVNANRKALREELPDRVLQG